MTKALGLQLLVSGRVADGVKSGLCPLGSFRVKGRRGGLPVFTAVDGDIGEWPAAMEMVRRGEFVEAKAVLEAVPGDGPLAGAARFYLGWIERWLAEPPEDWDGVVTLESK